MGIIWSSNCLSMGERLGIHECMILEAFWHSVYLIYTSLIAMMSMMKKFGLRLVLCIVTETAIDLG